MQSFISDLRSALKEIYRTVRYDMIDELYQYNGYGAGGDLSSNVDLLAEKIYVKHLSRYGQIISEESGIIGNGEWKLIIDPIDGSDNLLSSFPYYGTSIAVQKDGEMLLSCVANFANGDLFIKHDAGFFKGNILESDMKPIRYHPFSKIGLFEKAYANPQIVARLNANGLKFRSPGAVALSLAYAYAVKYVLFVGKIREYDIAAGLHLCSDCHIYQDTTRIIVSKDKAIFDKIKEIVLKDE
ncbi:inositol monophosphatase family protein [Nitratiruptor sp. SB155-2]|uniref:inositol monophosphatase family protein n=1 Tax=Nitratiruptor sp. (strain SB155-2) TaxID=387092 RepID=UPI00015870F9|nr:inositol monophosphatase family protein [Nitratiruptor sp. SB155-2]BAF70308.1 inositol monophosphatase family protein [Nitratiruptor sp. SB155-2]